MQRASHLHNDDGRAGQGSRNSPAEVPDGDAIAGVGDVVAAELLREAEGDEDEDHGEEVEQVRLHCFSAADAY